MSNRIKEAIHDQNGNYILPFFWMHGAKEEVIRELMGKVYDAGIRAVCLESRPHPDYVGERWWQDVDVVLDEAVKREMKVWILDDSHFPTGQANGAVVHADPRLKRWSLMERHYDLKGPVCGEKYDISHNLNMDMKTRSSNPEYFQESVVAVLLGKKTENGNYEIKDVTAEVEAGWLYIEEPEGEYRLWILTKKLHAALMLSEGVSNLEPESVRILIDTVYEAHYKRYKEYFGKTIAGFFSDEPGFFNLAHAGYGMPDKVGLGSMPLPWSEDVYRLLQEEYGEKTSTLLPSLFDTCGGDTPIRFSYMDIVSKKYEENFTNQLGRWCQEHGVEYIGHIVEDYPMYERLGPSTGHYFRALRGQAMSGIDVVLRQLLPEEDEGRGAFYHYGLAELGASLANQNPAQKGRAMCEIFGAFGWVEGVSMMKWMADHMLVNGINTFVPHAFTEAEFPDPDCPPHFYARGNNPQYPFLSIVFSYMNRMAHMLQGGTPLVHSAIFFEAESDWVGESEPFFVIGKEFLTRQVPYHVLCMDFLKEAVIKEGKIQVGNMVYDHLFLSKAAYMKEEYAKVLADLSEKGASLYFVEGKPQSFCMEALSCLEAIPCISKAEACQIAMKCAEVQLVLPEEKWLRVYPYRQENNETGTSATIYMVFNESGKEEIRTSLRFKGQTPTLCYDVLNQKLTRLSVNAAGEVEICLAPSESFVLLSGCETEFDKTAAESVSAVGNTAILQGRESVAYDGSYRISLCGYQQLAASEKGEAVYEELEETEVLFDIARKCPGFAGRVRYELSFQDDGYGQIFLPDGQEGIEVFLNGECLGAKISAPYLFEIDGKTRQGENHLRIELATTVVNAVPDGISCQGAIPPTGIRKPVLFYKNGS